MTSRTHNTRATASAARARRGLLCLLVGFACLSGALRAGAVSAQVVPPELAHRATVEGSVPVIVHLAVTMTPEGHLADDVTVLGQRQWIAAAQRVVLAALTRQLHRVRHRYETLPLLALDAGPTALAILDAMTGTVIRVEEDALASPMLAQSVPLVQGPGAWAQDFTGTGQVVAILDTGVDKAHSFLLGKVVEEACYSSRGNCPNGSTTQTGSGAGVPCRYAASSCQHGTHVAGIAAGLGTSSSGVARGANLMAVQVFSRFTGADCAGDENPCARSFTSDQIKGLERVYALRNTYAIASVNMSIGGDQFSANCDTNPTKLAIDNLRSVGIATVIASGNNGLTNSLSAPACISTAVSVGSTDDGSFGTVANAISPFSNSATFLSLLAPGSWITSSVPGNAFATFRGTSMAAPHVAGTWALLKQANPVATVDEILSVIQTTGLPITDSRNGVTKSRISVVDALTEISQCTPPCADYFGDHLTVFRPSIGTWYILDPATLAARAEQWGVAGDIPLPGDYDGDGKADITVFRPSTGVWYILNSSFGGVTSRQWGAAGDRPVPRDYDGDGRTDIAVYRPSSGVWYVLRSSSGTVQSQQWGASTDLPVPGDYDGDGRTDIAVYRPSSGVWYVLRSSSGTVQSQQWGASTDLPVPGDYDGDGRTDIAVYRPSSGVWYVLRSSSGTVQSQQWGASTDLPVPGDYDGDGRTDIAVYRPSSGVWDILRSSSGTVQSQQWGAGGDQPLLGRF